MRVMILGHTGLLGRELVKQLSKNHTVETIPRWILDARDPDNAVAFRIALGNFQPDVVINCIGITNKRVTDPVESIGVNSIFPRKLAKMLEQHGARLIHISTDCAHDDTLYGKSKLLGEIGRPHLTLRTSFIGHHPTDKSGLVEWFLGAGEEVEGYTEALYSGLTTIELARAIEHVLKPRRVPLAGVWNVGGERISKYHLLRLLKNQYRPETHVMADDSLKIDRSFDSLPFQQAVGWSPPSWDKMIEEMADDYYSQR
jgi:dTDP-4-dehydrorhamnose reductase